jgi:hypothetical protein
MKRMSTQVAKRLFHNDMVETYILFVGFWADRREEFVSIVTENCEKKAERQVYPCFVFILLGVGSRDDR